MNTIRFHLAALLLCAPLTFAAPSAPWHHPLYLANGGYWPQRVAVTIENPTDVAVAGEPVLVKAPALAGARVESVRVCNAAGQELLFDVRDAGGHVKRTGKLAADDQLVVPAECGAKSAATIYVYAGNDAALAVPDFLKFGFVNGDFESGGDVPAGWKAVETDAKHVASYEKSGGRNGSRCVKVEVAASTEPTWVKWNQTQIPVTPGQTYHISGWVKAENVVGRAGWFLHVNGERPMLLGPILDAGSGTFDWKRVEHTFTVPPTGSNATFGTVLRGTGRAWFDDAEFVETGSKPALRATAGALEQIAPTPASGAKAAFSRDWPCRATVRVLNPDDTPTGAALVHADLRIARGRLRKLPAAAALHVVDAATGTPVASCLRMTDGVLFTAPSLPPRSVREFHIYFGSTKSAEEDAFIAGYEQLLNSPLNLAPNPSFEAGVNLPYGWARANESPGRKFGVSADARFGRRSAEFAIAADAKPNWTGWRSEPIPVQPGASYLYGGFFKSQGVGGTATLHAHVLNASGKAITFASTMPHLSGDSGWTNSVAFIQTGADAASVTLHLTMNTQGTLRHDGVLFCRALQGEVTRLENAETVAAVSDRRSGSTMKAGGQRPPLQLWEVNPLVKVFPDDLPEPAAKTVTVECARNEYEPFQLVLRSDKALHGVEVTVSSLKNAKGATLPAVKVERVGFVPVDHPSGYFHTDVADWQRRVARGRGSTDGWAGEWPDPLIPIMMPARQAAPDQGGIEPPHSSGFDLAAGRAQPLWFTVRAPADAAPGEYHGVIAIRAAEFGSRLSAATGRGAEAAPKFLKLPLRVTVLPFELPKSTRLKTIFDFRFHGDEATRRQWLRFMAERRLGISHVEPAPVFSYQDGKVTMDATAFDETARYCFDELGMQVAYTPWFFYMFGWAYPPKKMFGLEPFTPEYNAAFKQAYRLFTDHVKTRGWHDKFVYYISDEPHFHNQEFVVEQMKKLCALIHEVDKTIPIYSSTWRHCKEWDNSLDLWGVGQYGCFPVAELEQVRRAGKNFWWTCDGQMATDTPYLATERMLPYYCFKYGATGFEFWGIDWWTYDPWERGWHTFIRQSDDGKRHYWVRYPNGDGYLAYPGAKVGVDGPVSTIRLEQVREGLEDYEAIAMLAELVEKAKAAGKPCAAGEKVLAMARDLVTIPNAGGLRSTEILPDPDRIPAIRKAVNAAIVKLMK